MEYEIDDDYGAVPEWFRYSIEDTPETEKQWRSLQKAFAEAFPEYTSDDCRDYELPDWHDGMRVLFVYLYNPGFYNEVFLPKVKRILEQTRHEAFAMFECFDDSDHLVGQFMVFKDKVIFTRMSAETGLLRKLIGPSS